MRSCGIHGGCAALIHPTYKPANFVDKRSASTNTDELSGSSILGTRRCANPTYKRLENLMKLQQLQPDPEQDQNIVRDIEYFLQ